MQLEFSVYIVNIYQYCIHKFLGHELCIVYLHFLIIICRNTKLKCTYKFKFSVVFYEIFINFICLGFLKWK